MKETVLRIALIGPESSGKSELCSGLAMHYKTNWVPEYSRIYLPQLPLPYSVDDIVSIYLHQYMQEKELMKNSNKLIFTDTEFIIAKVWCESAFGFCPEIIEANIAAFPYDLYLLTAPDLPWVFDPLRENPGKGDFYFSWYMRILEERNLKFGVVSGSGNERLHNAVEVVDKFLKTENSYKI